MEMEKMKNICIYGASSSNIADEFKSAAFVTGELIAEKGYGLVSGGGRGGLMASAIDGCLSRGGKAIGILPNFMIMQEWQHKGLTQTIVTEDMHERKRTMASMSCGIIALPGGVGTLEELLEIITWKQLGLYVGNVVILNVNGFYDSLLKMFDEIISLGFMRENSINLWKTALSAEEAVNLVTQTID